MPPIACRCVERLPSATDPADQKLLNCRRARVPEALDAWAARELEMVHHYDYHIINDHLATAYTVLKSIFIAEEH